MRILIDLTHPAHPHFFRHAIAELRNRGHVVALTCREGSIPRPLLEGLKLPAKPVGRTGTGRLGAVGRLLTRDLHLWRHARRFRPDILTGISGVFVAHVGRLMGKPSVVWTDTEPGRLPQRLTWPFATRICTPDCFGLDAGHKQVRYAGLHELAYLHPKRFTPDRRVVESLGINPDEPYCIIRTSTWGAQHDIGQRGITDLGQLVRTIEPHARPYISYEGPAAAELEPYRLRIPLECIHHVLAFASLYVGEGATMTTESALLGTPAIYASSLDVGTVRMLSQHDLAWRIPDQRDVLDRAREILSDSSAKRQAMQKRDRLLEGMIDVTEFIVATLKDAAATDRTSAS